MAAQGKEYEESKTSQPKIYLDRNERKRLARE